MPETHTTNGNGAAGPHRWSWSAEARKKQSEIMKAAHAAKKGPWKGSRKNGKKAAPQKKLRGRGVRLPPSDVARLREMLLAGATLEEVSGALNVAKSTVARHKRELAQGKAVVKSKRGTVVAVRPEVLPVGRLPQRDRGVEALRKARKSAYQLAQMGYEFNTLELAALLGQALHEEGLANEELPQDQGILTLRQFRKAAYRKAQGGYEFKPLELEFLWAEAVNMDDDK